MKASYVFVLFIPDVTPACEPEFGASFFFSRFVCPPHISTQCRFSVSWEIPFEPTAYDARRLRGVYFIDPDDAEFKEIMKNLRRKLEIPMPAAMSCKHQRALKNTRQSTLVLLKPMNL